MHDLANPLSNNNVLSLANRIAQHRNAYPDLTADHYLQLRQQELFMELTQNLQISLEIDEIITMLLEQLRKLLPVDGISYQYGPLDFEFSSPVQGRHKTSYQLDLEKEDLGLISFSRRSRFKEEELACIENLMSCLLYPLRNGLKYHSALIAAATDPLTGAGNRFALNNALEHEINLALRNDSPLSVVIFDFDNFKKLNDSHGHHCGDLVLKEITREVKQLIRKTDQLFRYGGEEFVLLLNSTSLTSATEVANKVREHIANTVIKFQQQEISISASMGTATFQKGDAIDTLINRADHAMFCAKDQGRNRVCAEAQP